MSNLTVETEDAFCSLLELAADNDVEGFKRSVECDPSTIDEVGLWYVREKSSKQMVYEHRTPLMVAALYGSIDVLKLILSFSIVDVNRSCGSNKTTALHCASSGGSVNAIDVVKLLLEAGADPNAIDASGRRPSNVIVISPGQNDVKFALEELLSNGSPSSTSENSLFSPMNSKFDHQTLTSSLLEKKEYPIDPSLPDIKNSIYATDEFRMYSFKVRPCSRGYSHDWTECPFVHPGENARRRDPRKYHYSCVPCPDFRKGACRRGDMCEYAHGVFECWLHPAQYRTRLCKDGVNCTRRVCFFAHKPEELRPLYSTGPALHTPSSMNFLPGSPSSVMSPTPFTPPMSPSSNDVSLASAWPQPDVPSLRLPSSNLQTSRLGSSLNARDIPVDDFDMMSDYNVQHQYQHILNDMSFLSMNPNSLTRSGCSKTLKPSNLDDLFSTESLSPRYADQTMTSSTIYSPTHKAAILSQFNTGFSPRSVDHHPLQLSGRMSPRNVEPISPMSARASVFGQQREQQLHQFRSLSSRDLGSNLGSIAPMHSWSRWGSECEPDWSLDQDEFSRLRRSNSFEIRNNGEEPDLSWVQSLVKESPTDIKEKTEIPSSNIASSSDFQP